MSLSKNTEIDGFQPIWMPKGNRSGIQAAKSPILSPRTLPTTVNAGAQL